MKTSELTGALLDYWVAKAEDIQSAWIANEDGEEPTCILGPVAMDRFEWSPSTCWAQGGPIIAHERITVQASAAGDWRAYASDGQRIDGIQARGDAPLIAAMRAYIASKFGDTVPDEVAA